MKSKVISLATGLLMTFFSMQGVAENSTQIPGYTIHHNAFTTDSLTPQVAKTYELQRSKNRGMINVSVIKELPGTVGKPVHAEIHAQATNLTGQSREIPLREVRDGDAIYYIGDFRVADQETLNFVLQVKPEGASHSYTANLTQQFFTR